jgi:hypothetical protein
MVFESRFQRNLFVNAAFGLIPDALIGIGVAYFTDSGLIGMVGTVIGLQLLYFLIWLKSFLLRLLLLWLTGRKKLVSYYSDLLTFNRFPEPGDYLRDADVYFANTMDDKSLPCALRMKAAIELASIDAAKRLGFGLLTISMHMAAEDAIEQYKRTFVHDGEREDDG